MPKVVGKLPNPFPIGYGPSATKPLATREFLFFVIIFGIHHLHKDRLACDSAISPRHTTRCATAKVCAIHPEVNHSTQQKVDKVCEGDILPLSRHTTGVRNAVVRVHTNFLVEGVSHVIKITLSSVCATCNLVHVAFVSSLSREDSDCKNRLLEGKLDDQFGRSSNSNIQRQSALTQCVMHNVPTGESQSL